MKTLLNGSNLIDAVVTLKNGKEITIDKLQSIFYSSEFVQISSEEKEFIFSLTEISSIITEKVPF